MNKVDFDEVVPSDRDPRRTYHVRGALACECTGFVTHGYCKHIRRIVDELLSPRRKEKFQ